MKTTADPTSTANAKQKPMITSVLVFGVTGSSARIVASRSFPSGEAQKDGPGGDSRPTRILRALPSSAGGDCMTASMEKGVSRAMELASARQIAAQSPPLEARPHPWLRNATIHCRRRNSLRQSRPDRRSKCLDSADRRSQRCNRNRCGGSGLSHENA